jgi:hypothetical protein
VFACSQCVYAIEMKALMYRHQHPPDESIRKLQSLIRELCDEIRHRSLLGLVDLESLEVRDHGGTGNNGKSNDVIC